MTIHLANRQRSIPLNLPWLQNFANLALQKSVSHSANLLFALSKLDEIEVAIVSDRTIAKVHRDFMDIPGPTDVITFEHGEIVMSAHTAQNYASTYGHPTEIELALYTIHGLLHLNGFDDQQPEDAALMKITQERLLHDCLELLPKL
ncbi:MAG: rRNA maturation RNase YbeY [Verrucomicrobia bacterium]|nr:rRNA maturation RNase YbeY [Verrucomicrobiota bacterium]